MSSESSSSSNGTSSSSTADHTHSDSLTEDIIAQLLASPSASKDSTSTVAPTSSVHANAAAPHSDHLSSAATEAILEAKPIEKHDFSSALPDLAPQVLSPLGGSPTNASSSAKFDFQKK